MSRTRLLAAIAAVTAGMLVLAACGGDDSSSTGPVDSAGSAAAPPATSAPAQDVTEAPAARNPYGAYDYGAAPPSTDAPASVATTPSPAAPTAAPAAVETADAAAVGPTESALGTMLADASGLTVYGFTRDTGGTPTCADACADAWPPVTVAGDALPEGLDPAVFSVVARGDGTFQLKAGDWPLYRFAGDASPGDTNGQASGGVWFVVAPDGTLIQ